MMPSHRPDPEDIDPAAYQSLFDTLQVPILLIDEQNTAIVHANPAACASCGYTHDELQQHIFAAKVQTISLDESYRQGDLESAQTDLNQIQSLLDESISLTRNLSIDLSPALLQGEGVSDALAWLAAQMQENYGLDVNIQTNGVSTRFEDALRILLFQAVREALFNVVKHAQTLHAAITVNKSDGHIQITVSDGGVGFPSNSLNPKNGIGGLAHLRRRVHLKGCNLEVQSQPGKGTRVIIQVPADQVIS